MRQSTAKTKKREIKLLFNLFKEGRNYIAYSPALDLSTFGKTEKEAKDNFSEIVELFFDELEELGSLERVLTDLGWRKIKKEWNPPVVGNIKIALPAGV